MSSGYFKTLRALAAHNTFRCEDIASYAEAVSAQGPGVLKIPASNEAVALLYCTCTHKLPRAVVAPDVWINEIEQGEPYDLGDGSFFVVPTYGAFKSSGYPIVVQRIAPDAYEVHTSFHGAVMAVLMSVRDYGINNVRLLISCGALQAVVSQALVPTAMRAVLLARAKAKLSLEVPEKWTAKALREKREQAHDAYIDQCRKGERHRFYTRDDLARASRDYCAALIAGPLVDALANSL